MKFLLAGNPNCGKSTLWSALTGGRAHTGNYPGVTVEITEGRILGKYLPEGGTAVAADLPGTCSLRPSSPEEETACAMLRAGADCVIFVIDATAPVRGTAMLAELLAAELPVVAAVNLCDSLEAHGGSFRADVFSRALGVPAVAVSAQSGQGLPELIEAAFRAAREPADPARAAAAARLGARTTAEARRFDPVTAAAKARFDLAEEVVAEAFVLPPAGEDRASARADALLLGRRTALPCLALSAAAVMALTFVFPGGFLSDLLSSAVERAGEAVGTFLRGRGVPAAVVSCVSDGVLGGVGGVLGFLPVVLTLYFCVALWEDSGYMARAVFLCDRALRSLGLSGRALIPLLTGFGCTVPAVLASRTVTDPRERRRTALLLPFVCCSAKLPVFAVFCAAFFPGRAALVCAALIGGGLLVGAGAAGLFRAAGKRRAPSPLLLELPPLRRPSVASVAGKLAVRTGDFLRRAFGVILLSSLAVWFLSSFSPTLAPVVRPEESLLYAAGRYLAPVFAPIGGGSPAAAAALIAGLAAKESVVSTLSVLAGGASRIPCFFTARTAVPYLVFVLLYSPCAAALAAVRREFGVRQALLTALLPTAAAYLCAAAVRLALGEWF